MGQRLMTVGFKQLVWHDVVSDFTASHEHWAQPHWADGACFFASACLLDDLLQAGVTAELWETTMPRNAERRTIYAGHYFVVVDGWAIAFPAWQFSPEVAFPIIERVSEYRDRFDGARVSEEDWIKAH